MKVGAVTDPYLTGCEKEGEGAGVIEEFFTRVAFSSTRG